MREVDFSRYLCVSKEKIIYLKEMEIYSSGVPTLLVFIKLYYIIDVFMEFFFYFVHYRIRNNHGLEFQLCSRKCTNNVKIMYCVRDEFNLSVIEMTKSSGRTCIFPKFLPRENESY